MMHIFTQHWPDVFAVAGGLFGMVGAFLVANKHLNVRFARIPGHMLFSFFSKTERARVEEQISDWTAEDALQSIRGLALIAVGFFLQMVPNIINLFA